MDINALIMLPGRGGNSENALTSKGIAACVERIRGLLPAGIDPILLMLPEQQEKMAGLDLPVIYQKKGALLDSLIVALRTQEVGRLLILDGADISISCEQLESMLDYSSRLPHMAVTAVLGEKPLLLPVILPVCVKDDIESFLDSDTGDLEQWLAQGVYIECDLSESGRI